MPRICRHFFSIFTIDGQYAENVETPVGKFVCFKIIQTIEADYPLIDTAGHKYHMDWQRYGRGEI